MLSSRAPLLHSGPCPSRCVLGTRNIIRTVMLESFLPANTSAPCVNFFWSHMVSGLLFLSRARWKRNRMLLLLVAQASAYACRCEDAIRVIDVPQIVVPLHHRRERERQRCLYLSIFLNLFFFLQWLAKHLFIRLFVCRLLGHKFN